VSYCETNYTHEDELHGVTLEFLITGSAFTGERQTRDYPGSPDGVEDIRVKLLSATDDDGEPVGVSSQEAEAALEKLLESDRDLWRKIEYDMLEDASARSEPDWDALAEPREEMRRLRREEGVL
jgi:hypothetical protein